MGIPQEEDFAPTQSRQKNPSRPVIIVIAVILSLAILTSMLVQTKQTSKGNGVFSLDLLNRINANGGAFLQPPTETNGEAVYFMPCKDNCVAILQAFLLAQNKVNHCWANSKVVEITKVKEGRRTYLRVTFVRQSASDNLFATTRR
jgi:hypothetical protein